MDQQSETGLLLIKELKPMLLICRSRLQNILHPLLQLAVLSPSITGYEPRKLFAFSLTVEQISQCSGIWHERGVESTKTTYQKTENLQFFYGRAEAKQIVFKISQKSSSKQKAKGGTAG
jgi:hypothetical protein